MIRLEAHVELKLMNFELFELKVIDSSFSSSSSCFKLGQTVPCRAIRGNNVSVSRTLPPSYRWFITIITTITSITIITVTIMTVITVTITITTIIIIIIIIRYCCYYYGYYYHYYYHCRWPSSSSWRTAASP